MKTEFIERKELLEKKNLDNIFNIIETEKENLSKEYNYIQLCNLIRDTIKQIDTYKRQTGIDSLLLQHKDFQIKILDERCKLYEKQVKLVRPKWYESKYIYWIQGSAIILIGSWVSSNVR